MKEVVLNLIDVLIISDQAVISKCVCKSLERRTLNARIVQSVAEARSLFSSLPAKVVLMDAHFLQESGFEFLKELREGDCDFPYFLMESVPNDLQPASHGAEAFLSRDFDIERFADMIENLLSSCYFRNGRRRHPASFQKSR